MTYAKTELFSKDLQEASEFFKVLSHPARLAILKYLAETRVCISGDISEFIPLGRTTVNQHLKELKKLNLIKGTIEGSRVNYCLNPGVFRNLLNNSTNLLEEISLGQEEGYC